RARPPNCPPMPPCARSGWRFDPVGSTKRNCLELQLNRLTRIRHRRSEAAVYRNRLAVDVTRLVARQEQSHRREFVRLSRTLERVELADLVLRAALLGAVEHWLGHAGLDQAGADRVDAHAGAG